MPTQQRLVLFVEGPGDENAAPELVRRLLDRHEASDCFFIDPKPFRVRDVFNLTGRNEGNWQRWLAAALHTRSNSGAVLLLLDGDHDGRKIATSQGPQEFCAWRTAELLARRAREARAGERFSAAVVFARQEYESRLIGGVPALAEIYEAESKGDFNKLEFAPRDAKNWIRKHRYESYQPPRDQASLTSDLNLDLAAKRLRSFQRLDNAIHQLVEANRSQRYIVTPCLAS